MYEISHLGIQAEEEFLLYLARTTRNEWGENKIQLLLRQGINWNELQRLTAYHRVIPLVYRSLRYSCGGGTPISILHEFHKFNDAIARRNLFLTGELVKLNELLEKKGILSIPYKGPTLALLAYKNIGLRQFGDLDILVHSRDYQRTKEVLLESGYRMGSDWGWECSLVDDTHAVAIDLHMGIAPEIFSVRLDFKGLQERLEQLSIDRVKIKFNAPCAEDMLLILCIQLGKDAWGENAIRLSKVCDIAELLRTRSTMNWNLVAQEAKRLGCWRMTLLGLFVAHTMLGAPIPDSLVSEVHAQPGISVLTTHIYQELFSKDKTIHTTRLSRESFFFKLRERWRDKLFPHYHALRLHVTPNEKDLALLALPKSLGFLYYLIRPIRLARDYGVLLFTWSKTK